MVRRESLGRTLLRYIPVLSKIPEKLDLLEGAIQQLKEEIQPLREGNQKLSEDNQKLRELLLPPLRQSLSPVQRAADGLPLPPPRLRYWVAGTEEPDWFLESGRRGAQNIIGILAKSKISLDQFDSILDFGCGCGRMLRHFSKYESIKIHGTDSNQEAIGWCDENLDFAEFATNPLEPPTRYRKHSFDLIYAYSVFTHLPEPMQLRWMNELCRILKPGGYLIITVIGDHYLSQLSEFELAEYRQGNLVVKYQDKCGQNHCAAYHPESYVRNFLARNFEVIDFIPQGSPDDPLQDVYLLRSHSESP